MRTVLAAVLALVASVSAATGCATAAARVDGAASTEHASEPNGAAEPPSAAPSSPAPSSNPVLAKLAAPVRARDVARDTIRRRDIALGIPPQRPPYNRHLKKSVLFGADELAEMTAESKRQGRSLSGLLQQAWELARPTMAKFPGVSP